MSEEREMGEDYSVVEMNTSEKWWDRWFVVANLTIDRMLPDYNYFGLSPVYVITCGQRERKEFILQKPRRNLQGKWSKCDILDFIDDLGGVLTEAEKFCGNDIFAVTQEYVKGEDGKWKQNIYVFFGMKMEEESRIIEKFLNENNYNFIMADDIPFTD